MHLLILGLLFITTSCSSLVSDLYRSEKVSEISGVDFNVSKHRILSYRTNNGRDAYIHGNTKPEEVKAIFEKAKSWHNQSKNKKVDFIKEIDSFMLGNLKFEYNNKADPKESFVSVCFKNEQFTHLTDIHCGVASMDKVDKVISDLSEENVNKVIELLAQQKDAAAELQ